MKKDTDALALKVFDMAVENTQHSVIIQLLTTKEKITIGRRLLIAQAILSGKTRFEINEEIGVSPNTFAQINRWIESELGEYKSAYLSQQVSHKHSSKHVKPFTYEHLKKKFPAHFLLFTLIKNLNK